MPVAHATAIWTGNLTEGSGQVSGKTGAFTLPYSTKSRFGEEANTNPEELIGAAHAGCYAMMLSLLLTQVGTPPQSLQADATVTLSPKDGGFHISKIALVVRGKVEGIDNEAFLAHAENAKANCPISVALAGVGEITLDAALEG